MSRSQNPDHTHQLPKRRRKSARLCKRLLTSRLVRREYTGRVLGTHLDRDELERLRDTKRCRTCLRLNSPETVEYEFRAFEPPRYAYVRFECAPANDLSFEARALWPPTVSDSYATEVELAVAEGVADVLLEGLYQHSGCRVVLTDVRYDQIDSTIAAFMKAAESAMRSLLSRKWTPVGPPGATSDP
jgi:hypothetical protein